jgi:putative membrane protein
VIVVSYTFFGLDALGDQLEDPFGADKNDLPLDALTRMLERELLEAVGAKELPPPLVPKNFVLH